MSGLEDLSAEQLFLRALGGAVGDESVHETAAEGLLHELETEASAWSGVLLSAATDARPGVEATVPAVDLATVFQTFERRIGTVTELLRRERVAKARAAEVTS